MNTKISRALNYLDQHYVEEVSLPRLAAAVHMHPDYLSRCFKREVGMRVHQYLLLRRISQARQLLLDPAHSIREVSGEVGFHNPEVFSRAFKRLIGCSPRLYRRRASCPMIRPPNGGICLPNPAESPSSSF